MEDYIRLKTKLDFSKSLDIDCIDIDEVDDITNIKIDKNMSKVTKVMDFLKKVKNPYFFTVDGTKVKFEYSNNSTTINDCLEKMIMNQL